jgi:hemerythrin-like domain-containing protein
MSDAVQTNIEPNIGRDFIRIHRVISRAIKVSVEKAAEYTQSGAAEAAPPEGFLLFLRTLAQALDGHHLTEDDLAFPLIRERIPEAPYEQLIREHQEIVSVLEEIQAAIAAIESNPGALSERTRLSNLLVQLNDLWIPHKETEEQYFSPTRTAEVYSVEENKELGQKMASHGVQHSGPEYLALPFILYNMEASEREKVMLFLPPVVTQELMPGPWKEKWAPMQPYLLP